MKNIIRSLLITTAFLPSFANAGSLAVTPGSGATVGAGSDGTNQIPAHILCGATATATLYATCVNQAIVNASGQILTLDTITGTVPLPTGAATSANQEVTAAGTTATSAQGVQGVTGGVPLSVTGSFSTTNSAFVQGATPMSAITLVGGTPQSNIAIPSGTTTLLITSANSGANVVHCRLDTTTSTTASATDASILAGQTLPFNATGLGVVSCETGTGTQVVSFFPGSGSYEANSGLPPNIAATGSTIGFAGTVQGCASCVAIPTSIPDGGSVTLGSKADTALTTGSATEIALLKGAITQIQAGVYAGGGAATATATGVLTGGSDGTDFRNFLTSTSGHLVIDCGSAGGSCSGSGGTSAADAAAWTAGTSLQTAQGCEYTSGGATALVTAHMGTVACTTGRALFTDKSSVGGTALVAATSAYGTAPTGTAVEGVNAFITNATTNVANNATIANSGTAANSPVVNFNYGANSTNWIPTAVDSGGRTIDVGAGASASALVGNPVLIAGGNGTNAYTMLTDTSGRPIVAGAGTAGTATGGVLTVQGVASMTPVSSNTTQINSIAILTGTGATGTGAQRVTVATDTASVAGSTPAVAAFGVVGSAPVTGTRPMGVVTGGATTTGLLQNLTAPNASVAINVTSATTTQLVALTASQQIRVFGYDVVSAGAGTVQFEYGTSATCGAGIVALTGAYPLAANGGLSRANGIGAVFTVPAGDALCIVTTGSATAQGVISYAQY